MLLLSVKWFFDVQHLFQYDHAAEQKREQDRKRNQLQELEDNFKVSNIYDIYLKKCKMLFWMKIWCPK